MYLIKETYIDQLESGLRFRWTNVIWNRLLIPMTHFIYYMGALLKLKMKDKLGLLVWLLMIIALFVVFMLNPMPICF